jgi:hypothetical protein
MTADSRKPSEIMLDKALAHLDRVMPHYDSETQRQLHETRAFVRQMADCIDAEHERRANFEADAAQLSDILKRSQVDALKRIEALEGWRGGRGPKAEPREATTAEGALGSIPGTVLLSGMAELRPVRHAIPCSERMPEPQTRVLFYVPHRLSKKRWRTGSWDGASAWYDDVTDAGTSTLAGVTHWMPLPKDPA